VIPAPWGTSLGGRGKPAKGGVLEGGKMCQSGGIPVLSQGSEVPKRGVEQTVRNIKGAVIKKHRGRGTQTNGKKKNP